MGNCSHKQIKPKQTQNTMLATKRHESVKDKQFTPIKMSVLYECIDEELPETTSIREFGNRLHKFVCQRHADEIDNHLTLYDCYRIGGFISCSTGTNAGSIPLKAIKGENCQLAVAWILELRDELVELKINKQNKVYEWLIEGEILVERSKNHQFLLLYEDNEYYYTLNYPVMSFSVISPAIKLGQRMDTEKFKPIHKTYGADDVSYQHSGLRFWPFQWQQFHRKFDLEESKNGVFCPANDKISMRAAARVYDAARYVDAKVVGRDAFSGSGSMVSYMEEMKNEATGLGSVLHILLDPASVIYQSCSTANFDYGLCSDVIDLIDPVSNTLKQSYHLSKIAFNDGVTVVRNLGDINSEKLSYSMNLNVINGLDCDNWVIGSGYPQALPSNPKTILQNDIKTMVLFQLQVLARDSGILREILKKTNVTDIDAVGVGHMGGVGGQSGLHIVASKDDSGIVLGVYHGSVLLSLDFRGGARTTEASLFVMRNSTKMCDRFGGTKADITAEFADRYKNDVLLPGRVTDKCILREIKEQEEKEEDEKEDSTIKTVRKWLGIGVGITAAVGIGICGIYVGRNTTFLSQLIPRAPIGK